MSLIPLFEQGTSVILSLIHGKEQGIKALHFYHSIMTLLCLSKQSPFANAITSLISDSIKTAQ
jgi:hypothetical protein